MTDHIEATVAPSAIKRAVEIFGILKNRERDELVEARSAVTTHIFGRIAAGETDETRLVVSGLAHLKSLERFAETAR
jgi:hypothetical protein